MPLDEKYLISKSKAGENLFLPMTGMVFGDWLLHKKLKFNPRPFASPSPAPQPRPQPPDVGNHWEIIDKVDALIQQFEQQQIMEDPPQPPQPGFEKPTVETRQPLAKTVEPSGFETMIGHGDRPTFLGQEFTIEGPHPQKDTFRFIHSMDELRDTWEDTIIIPEKNKAVIQKLLGDVQNTTQVTQAFFKKDESEQTNTSQEQVSSTQTTTDTKQTPSTTEIEEIEIPVKKNGKKKTKQKQSIEETTIKEPEQPEPINEQPTQPETLQPEPETPTTPVQPAETEQTSQQETQPPTNGVAHAKEEYTEAKTVVESKKEQLKRIAEELKQQEHETKHKEKDLKKLEHEKKKKQKIEQKQKLLEEKQRLKEEQKQRELEKKQSYIPDIEPKKQGTQPEIISEPIIELPQQSTPPQQTPLQEPSTLVSEVVEETLGQVKVDSQPLNPKQQKKQMRKTQRKERIKQRLLKKQQALEAKQLKKSQNKIKQPKVKKEKTSKCGHLKKKDKKGETPQDTQLTETGEPEITLISETPIAQPTPNPTTVVDEDLRRFLVIADELLGKLPEEVIQEFAQSKDFAVYERVMSKYKK